MTFLQNWKNRKISKGKRKAQKGLSCVAKGEAGVNPSGYKLSTVSYELINYSIIYSND